MELSLISVSLSFLFVATLALAWSALNWVWFKPRRLERQLRKQGFQGNPYRILVGDTREFAGMLKQARSKPINLDEEIGPRVHPFIYQTVKNYGKNSFFWFGPKPRVIIMDPEHIKGIMNKMDSFRKLSSSNPLAKFLATGLVVLEGRNWAKHRKILNPAFRVEKLKLMIPAFYQSCNEMINKWEGLVPREGPFELDVWPDLKALSSDAISRTAFGSSYEEGRRIFELLRQLAVLTAQVLQSVYIPGSRFFPNKTVRKMKMMDDEVQDTIKAIINKREKLMIAGEPAGEDLLGMLMQSNHQEIQEQRNNRDSGMTHQDIIDECKLFYFAGQETTSTLILWTMILLSKHPDWQERAREEVLKVFGTQNPDSDGLSHLKIVPMILYEVLRLYPPIVTITRGVHEEITLGNLKLPSGVQVLMPTILVHYDREIWGKDTIKFNPERFSEGVSKATNNHVSFFPFGWGPRICIGQNFALMEAKIAMAMILQRFSLELSPSYTHAPYTVVALQPQYGAHLIFHKL